MLELQPLLSYGQLVNHKNIHTILSSPLIPSHPVHPPPPSPTNNKPIHPTLFFHSRLAFPFTTPPVQKEDEFVEGAVLVSDPITRRL